MNNIRFRFAENPRNIDERLHVTERRDASHESRYINDFDSLFFSSSQLLVYEMTFGLGHGRLVRGALDQTYSVTLRIMVKSRKKGILGGSAHVKAGDDVDGFNLFNQDWISGREC